MSNEQSIRKVKFSTSWKDSQYEWRERIYWRFSNKMDEPCKTDCYYGDGHFSIQLNRLEEFDTMCKEYRINYEILES